MKRYLALILVIITLICIGSIAMADEDNTRASNYFNSYGITLSKPGSNKINITFSCTAVGTASQIGVSNYSVYRYDDDDLVWELVSGPNSGSYSYNASSHSFAKTFQGSSIRNMVLAALPATTVSARTLSTRPKEKKQLKTLSAPFKTCSFIALLLCEKVDIASLWRKTKIIY